MRLSVSDHKILCSDKKLFERIVLIEHRPEVNRLTENESTGKLGALFCLEKILTTPLKYMRNFGFNCQAYCYFSGSTCPQLSETQINFSVYMKGKIRTTH